MPLPLWSCLPACLPVPRSLAIARRRLGYRGRQQDKLALQDKSTAQRMWEGWRLQGGASGDGGQGGELAAQREKNAALSREKLARNEYKTPSVDRGEEWQVCLFVCMGCLWAAAITGWVAGPRPRARGESMQAGCGAWFGQRASGQPARLLRAVRQAATVGALAVQLLAQRRPWERCDRCV